ncbi:hypothetical protein [Arthrobacter globiformis]|uniref:hypothetical protein n=1 Tax=Arthrobacter globiformis TaxID=1665 RepID=UPI0011B93CE2|nr:hypothetical protein [Arthrobacter globiformis]
MTKSSSGLRTAGRRTVSVFCVILGLIAFSAPVPVAVADEPASPAVEAPTPAPAVRLEGSPQIGSYLNVVFSGTKPAGSLSYQFLHDGEAFGPAVAWPYYFLRSMDFGKRISVRVTATQPDSEPKLLTSGETEPILGYITAWSHPDAMPVLGNELGVNLWTYNSEPSLSGANATITTAWFRDGTPIEGAPARYTVAEADMGAEITAEVTVSAAGYWNSWTGTTSFGTARRGSILPASSPVITAGTSTAAPYAAYPGQVLKASAPAVVTSSPTPFPPAPGSVTYTYLWSHDRGDKGMRAIPDVTGSTYTVRAEDIGYRISVYAKPVSPNFLTDGKRSDSSLQIYGKFAGMSAPTIKGTALAGQLLTAVPGPVPSPAPDAVSYSWYRSGIELAGPSTDPTYRLTTADAGHKMTVRAFYEKTSYDRGLSPASAAVAVPLNFILGPAPWIAGTAATGYTVSARTSPTTPSSTAAAYQWYRDGRPISGATGTAYRLTAADQGHLINFKVAFKRAGTITAFQTSRAIRPLAVFTKLPTPVVRGITLGGAFTAGQTLRASTAMPFPAPTAVTWQWQRNGRPIPGATGSSYRLTPGDGDKFIRVVATFKRPNYLNTGRISAQRWVWGPTTVL